MPPAIFNITEPLWKDVSLWKRIPYKIVEKYAWYISVINSLEYLIFPVTRQGNSIFYSARKLSSGEGLKYIYPKNVKRSPWISDDGLSEPIVICEGVADAAYTSQLASSIALLGNYYDVSLDEMLKGKKVILALDGDTIGLISSIRIYSYLQKLCNVSIHTFPENKEPVDFELSELKEELGL